MSPHPSFRPVTAAAVLLLLCLSLFTPTGRAAVTFDPAADLDTIDALLARAKPGEPEVCIDDMVFNVANLLRQKDSLLNKPLDRPEDSPSPESAVYTSANRWPGGVVPYAFDSTVNATQQGQFRAACDAWQEAANVTFVPRTTQANYVLVHSSTVNNSSIGMVGGQQIVNIVSWDWKFIIAHELAHALGMVHEQCRPDRNSYVHIYYENIISAMSFNFDIAAATTLSGYDFDSVMHYDRHAFNIPPYTADTILPIGSYANQADAIGQRTHLSVADKAGMVSLYGAAGPNLPNLTFTQPTGWSSALVVSNVTGTNTDSSNLLATDPLYVDFRIWNNGGVASPAATCKLYVDNALKLSFNVPGIAANSTSTATDAALGSLSAGTHTIRVDLDPDHVVTESNENDNSLSKTVTITGMTPQANMTFYQPSGWANKLVVTNKLGAIVDPASMGSADTLYANFVPYNNGTLASGPFTAQVFVDDRSVGTRSYAGLGTNTVTETHDFPLGTLAAGTHTVHVRVDAGGTVSESNEGDNDCYRTITVVAAAKPNLVFYQPGTWSGKVVVATAPNVFTDSATLLTTDTLYINYAPFNNGSLGTGSFTVNLYVDNALAKTDSLLGLGSNVYTTLSAALTNVTPGSHTLRVQLDADNTVDESNEADNTYTRTITVTASPQPNLTPYQLTGWSDKITASMVTGTKTDGVLNNTGPVYVNWAEINNGTGGTGVAVATAFLVDGVLVHTFTAPALAPGGAAAASDYDIGVLTAGLHTITIQVDPDNAIVESNETDNTYSRTFTVVDFTLPDLTFGQPAGWSSKLVVANVPGATADTPLRPTDTLYLNWDVLNTNTIVPIAVVTQFTPIYVQLLVDGVSRGYYQIFNPIGPGGDYPFLDIAIGSLPVGKHTLELDLDATGFIPENNENNNKYVRTITVQATPKDFNGDGTSDILWEDTKTGRRDLWTIRDNKQYQSATITTVSTDWRIAGAGDFDGDGHPDILWENSKTGEHNLWLMNGIGRLQTIKLSTISVEWRIGAVGDFDGDGKVDIVWNNTKTGQCNVWLMNGTALVKVLTAATIPVTWRIAAAGDLNGDGTSDIIWQDSVTGTRNVWTMHNGLQIRTTKLTVITPDWQIAGTGDFNGDGQCDIVWQNVKTGQRNLWTMNRGTLQTVTTLATVPVEWSIADH